MIEFTGFARGIEIGAGLQGRIVGHYRWQGRVDGLDWVEGEFDVDRSRPGANYLMLTTAAAAEQEESHVGWFDPLTAFNVEELRGRSAVIEIPDVGRFPARLFWSRGGRTKPVPRYLTVRFQGWAPPVPNATNRELADVLRTPIFDALEAAGHADLAALARAAAVALGGWVKPAKEEPAD